MTIQKISVPKGLAVHSVDCGMDEIIIIYDDKPKRTVIKGFHNEYRSIFRKDIWSEKCTFI